MSHPSSNKKRKTKDKNAEENKMEHQVSTVTITGQMPPLHVYVGCMFAGNNDLKKRICLNHELFGPVWDRMLKEKYDTKVKPTVTDFVIYWAMETNLIEYTHPTVNEKRNIQEYDKSVPHTTKRHLEKIYYKVLDESFNSQKYFFAYECDEHWYEVLDDNNSFEQFKVYLKKFINKSTGMNIIFKSTFIGYESKVDTLDHYCFSVPKLILNLFGFQENDCKVYPVEPVTQHRSESSEDDVMYF